MPKLHPGKSRERDDVTLLRKIKLWKGRPITIQKLEGGITNRNYLVRSGLAGYVARFAFPLNHFLGIDRKREVINTTRAAHMGLGPEVVEHLPEHCLLIVNYIEGFVFDEQSAQTPDSILGVAKLLRKLHNEGPQFAGYRDVFKDIDGYIAETLRQNSWMPENMESCLNILWGIETMLGVKETTACHFDLMLGNIVDTGVGLKLIDWEYSANGDSRFDVAMFALKASLTSEQEEVFLSEYNNKRHGHTVTASELQLMKMVVCVREASWGTLQYAISPMKNDFDYKKYAIEHLVRFDESRSKVPHFLLQR